MNTSSSPILCPILINGLSYYIFLLHSMDLKNSVRLYQTKQLPHSRWKKNSHKVLFRLQFHQVSIFIKRGNYSVSSAWINIIYQNPDLISSIVSVVCLHRCTSLGWIDFIWRKNVIHACYVINSIQTAIGQNYEISSDHLQINLLYSNRFKL